ncbi:hypothetical protein AURDEDRAFT_179749 [Auricularia subglabra TFB-10046 SS5]|nr:hypothetical protein AURDEDRAFT_179749 [Auricularia subglabra TFB-10046 SS5]
MADTTTDELSLSSLSINSQEDWDRSSSDIHFDSKPGSRPMTPKGTTVLKEGETPGKVASGKRRLAELLQKHTEEGKKVELSPEDEAKLGEELADWINSDSSPFEPDDDWFERKATELKAKKEASDAAKDS